MNQKNERIRTKKEQKLAKKNEQILPVFAINDVRRHFTVYTALHLKLPQPLCLAAAAAAAPSLPPVPVPVLVPVPLPPLLLLLPLLPPSLPLLPLSLLAQLYRVRVFAVWELQSEKGRKTCVGV
jgi:hypothetical protein